MMLMFTAPRHTRASVLQTLQRPWSLGQCRTSCMHLCVLCSCSYNGRTVNDLLGGHLTPRLATSARLVRCIDGVGNTTAQRVSACAAWSWCRTRASGHALPCCGSAAAAPRVCGRWMILGGFSGGGKPPGCSSQIAHCICTPCACTLCAPAGAAHHRRDGRHLLAHGEHHARLAELHGHPRADGLAIPGACACWVMHAATCQAGASRMRCLF